MVTTSDENDLKMWLLGWGDTKKNKEEPKEEDKVNINETFYPIVF